MQNCIPGGSRRHQLGSVHGHGHDEGLNQDSRKKNVDRQYITSHFADGFTCKTASDDETNTPLSL